LKSKQVKYRTTKKSLFESIVGDVHPGGIFVDRDSTHSSTQRDERSERFNQKNFNASVEAPGYGLAFPPVETSRRTFGSSLYAVLERADVIVQVLDARDPAGCRAKEVEDYLAANRPEVRVVLVLNKIDLAPREAVARWLERLRSEHPAVAFKSATGDARRRRSLLQNKVRVGDATSGQLGCSACVGGAELVQVLKSVGKRDDGPSMGGKTRVLVGVVGYPNVGKSSLINSLLRTKAAATGDRPGVTRALQEMHLDGCLTLIDTPGVVFDKSLSDASAILRNCIPIDKVSKA